MGTSLRLGERQEGILHTDSPVLLGHEEVRLRRLRIRLLGIGDRDHPHDLVAVPGHESGLQGVGGVLPRREQLGGVGGDVGQIHHLIADLPVELTVGAEVRAVGGVQRDRDDERLDGQCGGRHDSSFFQAPS